ncbi:hypothetical protein [Nonomuraea mesophila]|uniref:hypothetical protein n=1 Tax=Nonomuraea mesophila TaxID=2530382 RepID=UPI001FE8161E|nr:hypothetical protein [Nonomuraea mesophila]
MHDANLGTLLRTCDAVGACLAVPRLPWVPEALARGNTLRKGACVHWVRPLDWLARRQERVLGVELAEEAIRLADMPMVRSQTRRILLSPPCTIDGMTTYLVMMSP